MSNDMRLVHVHPQGSRHRSNAGVHCHHWMDLLAFATLAQEMVVVLLPSRRLKDANILYLSKSIKYYAPCFDDGDDDNTVHIISSKVWYSQRKKALRMR